MSLNVSIRTSLRCHVSRPLAVLSIYVLVAGEIVTKLNLIICTVEGQKPACTHISVALLQTEHFALRLQT